jgi:hypothetical protein
MKDKNEPLIKQVVSIDKSLNELTVDKVNETKPKEQETDTVIKLTTKERAKLEGIRYIEGKRLTPPLGVLPEKLRKEHAHDWEYVKGMFENQIIGGEGIKFGFCKYPGDPDLLFDIPANVPVYVPRMIAKHLESLEYHTFGFAPKLGKVVEGDFMENFEVSGTKSRGKFRAIEAFA